MRVSKNLGPILSGLRTEVHEILGHCTRSIAVVNARPRLSISCFSQKIFAVKFAVKWRTRRKNVNIGGFGSPILGEGGIPNFGQAFLIDTHFRGFG